MTTSTIKGTAYWAKVQTPVPTYDKTEDVYEITVGNLDKDSTSVVKNGMLSHRLNSGPDKKGNDYGPDWLSLYRKAKDGKPTIVGPDGITPFEGLVGNGSKVRVQFETWKSKNNFPNGHRILGIQILELVPFGVAAEASFEDASSEYEALPDTSVMSEVVFGDEDTPAKAE